MNRYFLLIVKEPAQHAADHIIDIGPDGGTSGEEIVFTGNLKEMIEKDKTITAEYLRISCF